MAVNVTLKNIPEEVYEKIKESARQNRRSINGELLYRMEDFYLRRSFDAKSFLKRVRKNRSKSEIRF